MANRGIMHDCPFTDLPNPIPNPAPGEKRHSYEYGIEPRPHSTMRAAGS